MSKFLSEVKGFTPVIDVLARELGLMTAVVYGVVWRYCQMENKICNASRERIAEHIGVSGKTVERHLKELCEHGYLKDLTPDDKHKPHVYADTGKAKINGLVSAEVGKTESPTSKQGKTESPKGETESPTRSDRKSNLGKTESLTRKASYDTPDDSNLGKNTEDGDKKFADPLNFDLHRRTAAVKENYANPNEDKLVTEAISCFSGGNGPRKGSGTWHDMFNVIKPVHADWGLHDMEVGAALNVIRAAIALFLDENQRMAVYRYPSFTANYGQYLSRTMNGDGQTPTDKYEEARRMTMERLGHNA